MNADTQPYRTSARANATRRRASVQAWHDSLAGGHPYRAYCARVLAEIDAITGDRVIQLPLFEERNAA